MTRILIVGGESGLNKGNAASRMGAAEGLKRLIPDAEFTLMTMDPEIDSRIYAEMKVVQAVITPTRAAQVVVRCLLWRSLRYILRRLGREIAAIERLVDFGQLSEYLQADVILEISGGGLTESRGRGIIYHYLHIWLATALGKPTVVYSASLGPPASRGLWKFIIRHVLNAVDLIITRGAVSADYVRGMGVNRPAIYSYHDGAFLMTAASNERVDEIFSECGIGQDDLLIGISVSRPIANQYRRSQGRPPRYNKLPPRYQEFIELMAKVVDHLTEELKATVLFVPHVTGPQELNDDRIISQAIYLASINKPSVKLIVNEYTPQEMKGIIGRCSLFVGARMHACISALSMGVPTINLSYHHKSEEVMEMLGQQDMICPARTLSYEELTAKINQLWLRRAQAREELTSRLGELELRGLLGLELIKDLIDSKTSMKDDVFP
jgi:colanic acid/amylovoran biosynthesis protein